MKGGRAVVLTSCGVDRNPDRGTAKTDGGNFGRVVLIIITGKRPELQRESLGGQGLDRLLTISTDKLP